MRNQPSRLRASVLVAVLLVLGVGACRPPTSPQRHEIVIDATSFSPSTLAVRVGDILVWTNRDLLVHTVTARSGAFDSKDIASGESWRFEVSEPGDLEYFCVYHPTMQGSFRAR